MSVSGANHSPNLSEVISPEEWLLRLNFNPEHIDNGEVIASAISLSDLRSRGYSIDREKLLEIATVADRAREQAEKKPEERRSPFLSRFECGPVCREVAIPEASPAFLVEASPVEQSDTQKANPAHAHIKSAAARPDSGLRRLRMLLLPHLQQLIALEQYAESRVKVYPSADPSRQA